MLFLKSRLDLVKEACEKCCYTVSGCRLNTVSPLPSMDLTSRRRTSMEEKTQCKESEKDTNAGRTATLCCFAPFGALGGCDESLTALDAAEKSGTLFFF